MGSFSETMKSHHRQSQEPLFRKHQQEEEVVGRSSVMGCTSKGHGAVKREEGCVKIKRGGQTSAEKMVEGVYLIQPNLGCLQN
mmetsp:Transcript_54810/g.111879  ORF Transcript_54810/g.111879 Transcript_54810/m.111879 type:complete len:83 (+) Transcript_54810:2468-2716(+)